MSQIPLTADVVYHIYNRGNNGENIFIEARNYDYFMKLYAKYITPVAETYAYCLLRNHFHLLVRIKDLEEINEHASFKDACSSSPDGVEHFISKQFGIFFGTYTKAINKTNSRSGTLFEGRFKRKPVTSNHYFKMLVAYIHQNPQRHGLIDDFRDWLYSSYQEIMSNKPTQLNRDVTLSWFDGHRELVKYHDTTSDFKGIADLVQGDS